MSDNYYDGANAAFPDPDKMSCQEGVLTRYGMGVYDAEREREKKSKKREDAMWESPAPESTPTKTLPPNSPIAHFSWALVIGVPVGIAGAFATELNYVVPVGNEIGVIFGCWGIATASIYGVLRAANALVSDGKKGPAKAPHHSSNVAGGIEVVPVYRTRTNTTAPKTNISLAQAPHHSSNVAGGSVLKHPLTFALLAAIGKGFLLDSQGICTGQEIAASMYMTGAVVSGLGYGFRSVAKELMGKANEFGRSGTARDFVRGCGFMLSGICAGFVPHPIPEVSAKLLITSGVLGVGSLLLGLFKPKKPNYHTANTEKKPRAQPK